MLLSCDKLSLKMDPTFIYFTIFYELKNVNDIQSWRNSAHYHVKYHRVQAMLTTDIHETANTDKTNYKVIQPATYNWSYHYE